MLPVHAKHFGLLQAILCMYKCSWLQGKRVCLATQQHLASHLVMTGLPAAPAHPQGLQVNQQLRCPLCVFP